MADARVPLPPWMQAWPPGLRPVRIRKGAARATLLYLHPTGAWCVVEVSAAGRATLGDGVGFAPEAQSRLVTALTARLREAPARKWLDEPVEPPPSGSLGARVLTAQTDLLAALEGLDCDHAPADEPASLACSAYLSAVAGLPELAIARATRAGELARGSPERGLVGRLLVMLEEPLFGLRCLQAGRLEGSVHWPTVAHAAARAADRAAAEDALHALASEPVLRIRALEHAVTAGAHRAAQRWLAGVASPGSEELARVAETHLFALELEPAEGLAQRALDADPNEPRARLVLAALEVIQGAHERALVALAPLESGPLTATTRLWMVRALLALHRTKDAAEVAHRHGFAERVSWKLWRALAEALVDPGPALRGPEAHQVRCILAELEGEEQTEVAYASDAGALALLKKAIDRFGGNYTETPTLLENGELVPLALRSPRTQAVDAQYLLARPGGFAHAFATLEDAERRMPSSPFPRTYRAELLLFSGDYAEARREFQRIWDETHTRWGYVGLGAACALLGDRAGALAAWEAGTEHFSYLAREATYAYRGEVHLDEGRLDAAQADLLHATTAEPARIGAWVALAILEHRRNDHAAAARALDQVRLRAPALVAECAFGLGIAARSSAPDDVAQIAEAARAALLGNRASKVITFRDRRGRMRAPLPLPGDRLRSLAEQLAPIALDAREA